MVSACPNSACHAPVLPSAAFCHQCGWPLHERTAAPRASLLAVASGRRYPLARAEVLVGRYDPASPPFPDIDLTAEDPNCTVSRHHARIVVQSGGYLLQVAEEARNPGEKDGTALTKGAAVPLRDGDRFTLGRVELQFEARAPTATARPTTELSPND